MLFAATFPERVDKLILLEGGLPLTGEPDEAPAGLRRSAARGACAARQERAACSRSAPTAIAERAAGFSKVTPAAAEVLARRSLREVPGGFQWHADQRLKAQSELRLTAEHVRAFTRRVTAPVLLLFAEQEPVRRPAALSGDAELVLEHRGRPRRRAGITAISKARKTRSPSASSAFSEHLIGRRARAIASQGDEAARVAGK